MIKLKDIIFEQGGAGEEAKKRGLKSIGFGRYVDPAKPETVVAKSVNGKLVAVKGAQDKGTKSPPQGRPSGQDDPGFDPKSGLASRDYGMGTDPKDDPDYERRKAADDPDYERRKAAGDVVPDGDDERRKAAGDVVPDDDISGDARSRMKDARARDRDVPGLGPHLNKVQGETLRKVFGRGVKLSKVKDVGDQKQMWWNLHNTGAHKAQMGGKFQQWQKQALDKVKRGIASDPRLGGWSPVFRKDSDTGDLHMVMIHNRGTDVAASKKSTNQMSSSEMQSNLDYWRSLPVKTNADLAQKEKKIKHWTSRIKKATGKGAEIGTFGRA